MTDKARDNARDLEAELAWLARLIEVRFERYFADAAGAGERPEPSPPDLDGSHSEYARFLREHRLCVAERVALALGLAPHVRPQLLDVFFTRNQTFDRPFTEFGGVHRGSGGAFEPTGETLAFILGGVDLETRFRVEAMFEPAHPFVRHDILRLEPLAPEQPALGAPLRLSREHLSYFTSGEARRPQFGAQFPAQHIETRLEWDDLVLHPGTRRQVEDVETWIQHGERLLDDWGMAAKLRPGYRGLFYGPPGTGKTMTACLLGKSTGRDVYKVDLSLVVSKYIGETEKNLARALRQGREQGLDPLLRRGRRPIRQAHAGARRPRPLRQPGESRLPAAAGGDLRRGW